MPIAERAEALASLACLGQRLQSIGRLEEARASWETCLILDPAANHVRFELANLLYALGRYDHAATQYQELVTRSPRHAEAYYNLGVTRTVQKRFREAIALYRQALALRPDYPDAHNNLAILLQTFVSRDEALGHYHAAGTLQARYNLALTLHKEEKYREAARIYREVLAQEPGHGDAHNNLGNILLGQGRPEEALAEYRRTVALDPDHIEANFNLGITQLLLGQWEEGWRGYDWRLRRKPPDARYAAPFWDGSPLEGKTILLHVEQGLGDTVQFVRYAPLVRERGGEVLVECQPALSDLLRATPGIDRLVSRAELLPDFEVQAPLMSLPRIFGTTVKTIPARVPYLGVEPDRLERWRRRITPGFNVGLTWSGNPDHPNNRRRSVPPEELRALAGLRGARFYCLQKGAADKAGIPGIDLIRLEDDTTTLADTAAILTHLDLLISVDTSVAHLAGALGRPVWLLLPVAADWRWLRGREDSPWYPTMRLFRQKRCKDWSPVLARVRRELESLAGAAGS